LRKTIRNIAKNIKLGGTKGGRNDGLLNGTTPYQFQYKNKTYELFATKESAKTFVKLHNKTDNKTIILKSDSFLQSAQGDFNDVAMKANTLASVKKPTQGQPSKPPSFFKDNKNIQQLFVTEVIELATQITQGKCVALDGACFVAGTKLWTPDGYRKVEEIRAGEFVYSRDQHKADGLIEPRSVEKVFMRLAEVANLHVGGEVIRTTSEHPFYAFDKGWTAARDLIDGDWILTATGDWKPVEEVYDTGILEVVYNLRVAEHHTYFVGEENWGWTAWAHNACITFDQHPITAGSGAIDTYVTPAFNERKKWANRPESLGGGKWKEGKGNIAMLTYTMNGMPATGTAYGSGDKDAEVNALNGLMHNPAGNSNFVVTSVFTERSMCNDCQKYFREHLRPNQIPESGKIDVYFMIPYVANSNDGSVLIQAYNDLGKTFPWQ
jgi:hypothetical protein